MINTHTLGIVTSKAKKCGALERDLELLEQQIADKRQNRQVLMSSLEAEITNLQRKREAVEFAYAEAETELNEAVSALMQEESHG